MNKMILILIIIFSQIVSADIRINEIMYNPYDSIQCPDANCEWIELYNNGTEIVKVEGWSIDDNNFGDLIILPDEYIIVARELIDLSGGDSFEAHWGDNNSIWDFNDGDYKAIDGYFSLKNSGDSIILKDENGGIIDSLTYLNSWGADGNGKTLGFYEGGWYESSVVGGSPGSENNYTKIGIDIVSYVVDGDTFELGTGERVRLIGIDTPEVGEYYYEEAKNKLKELVEGKFVILERDVEDKDKYDRLLRYVYLNNTFINLLLVEEGFAKAYPYEPNIKYKDKFADAEVKARNFSLGIWLVSQNYTFLRINEFLPDPKGYDDNAMPNGEWVEIYNYGNENLDLLGFKLKDDSGKVVFIDDVHVKENTTINSKDYLVVYMNGKYGFLNNDGLEKIKLYDFQGSLIDEISYSDSKEGISWSRYKDIWQLSLATPNSENKGEESVKDSKIRIKKIYGNKIKWGDIVRVKLEIYKADINRNSVKVWIEGKDDKKVSEEIKMNIYGKNFDYSLVLPVKIVDNCNNKFEDGEYEVVADGLDCEDSEEISIKGDDCVKEVEEKKEVVVEEFRSGPKEVDMKKPEKIIYSKNRVIYESNQNEIRRAGIFFMMGVVMLLLIYYVWRK